MGNSGAISQMVKEMVKEMDANEFYSMTDLSDEVIQEPWFSIELILESGGDKAASRTTLRKPWSEFQRLHYLLLTDEFGCNDSVKAQLPDLPSPPSGDDILSLSFLDVSQSLNIYFNGLLAVPAVLQSQVFSGFLDEQCRWRKSKVDESEHGSAGLQDADDVALDPNPKTAIDFLLQPFDYSKAYVPRRESHRVCIDVLRGESVVWKFIVEDHMDLEFSVAFQPHPVGPPPLATWPLSFEGDTAGASVQENKSNNDVLVQDPGMEQGAVVEECEMVGIEVKEKVDKDQGRQTVHHPTRYLTGAGEQPARGSFTCPMDGTCILLWDNSYSRLRGKRLSFVVESVTVDTMRAAIEAADAVVHKSRAMHSATAQAIIDNGLSKASVVISAVDTGADSGGSSESEVTTKAASSQRAWRRGIGSVRKIASGVLHHLGTLAGGDASVDNGQVVSMACRTKGGEGGSGDDGGGVSVEIGGVAELMAKFEELEDEVAVMSARRAQCEAQSKVLLATLQRENMKAERQDRALDETRTSLVNAREILEEARGERDVVKTEAKISGEKVCELEEKLLRSRREHDLLQAEKNVWHVARSGIQAELAKVVSELELERHRHEDASQALAKAHEARLRLESENSRLSKRLEGGGGRAAEAAAALERAQETSRLSQEEAEDARTAVSELDAAVAQLAAEKRVLVAELRAQRRSLGDRAAAAEAVAEEARMLRRAAEARVEALEEEAARQTAAQAGYEVRLNRLRAEKKVLMAEVRKGGAGRGTMVFGRVEGGVEGGNGARADSESTGRGRGGRARGDNEAMVSGSEKGVMEKEDLFVRDAAREARGKEGDDGNEVGDERRKAGMSSPSETGSVDGAVGEVSEEDERREQKALLKQLSRQLVHLRERQHHLREKIQEEAPDKVDPSAHRLQEDVERAVQNLETRIRRLLVASFQDPVSRGEQKEEVPGSVSAPGTGSSDSVQADTEVEAVLPRRSGTYTV